MQSKTNCIETMSNIEARFGPFEQGEIDFYIEQLNKDGDTYINSFQKQMVFNLFYKYFGDVQSINSINKVDYVKLIIAAKRILISSSMVMLPYVISGRVEKLISRKSINKKELTKLQMSPFYKSIIEKYKNDKIVKRILAMIATIISSEFTIIDYHDPDIHGRGIEVSPDLLCEEILMYVMMI